MARQTQATLTARVALASRALALPLQFHAGPDGFVPGALRLVRADGAWSLFQISNNAGAGERLVTGDAGDVVAFIDGMVAAAGVVAVAQRWASLQTMRNDAACGRPVSLSALARVV